MVDATIAARIRDHLAWHFTKNPAPSPACGQRPPTPEELTEQVHQLWPLRADEFGRGLYRLLFGRDPSGDELHRVVERVHAGDPRVDIVLRLAADREVIDRGLDPAWFRSLARSRSGEAVWEELLRCWGQPADQFVRRLYELLLFRPADPEGLSTHIGSLHGGRLRADVVRDFVSSDEFTRGRLGAPWLDRLTLLTPAGLSARFRLLYAESDDLFVRGLFASILFRQPTPAEVTTHLRILAAGTPRGQMVRAVLTCEEAGGRYTGAEWAGAEVDFTPAADSDASLPPREGELLGVPDRDRFVREAYRAVLGRYPTPTEVARQVRRLRYVPFYTRSLMLTRLARTWEAEAYRRARAAQDLAVLARAGRAPQPDGPEGERLNRVVGELAREQRVLREHAGSLERLNRVVGELAREQRVLRESVAGGFTGLTEAGAENRQTLGRELDEIRVHLRHLGRAVDEYAGRVGSLEQSGAEERRALGRQLEQVRQNLEGVEQLIRTAASDEPGGVKDRLRRIEEAVCTSLAALNTEQHRLREVQEVMRDEHRADAFAEQAWYNQLRRLGSAVARHTATPVSSRPVAAGLRTDRCRVCGGELSFRWAGRVLHGRYEAEYHECRACGALQVPDPHWLAEAYSGESAPQLWNPDEGRFRRNFSVYCHLRALVAAGLTGDRPRLLDYGGGYGLFTQMLLDAGLDAWTYDPHVGCPFFAPDRLITDPADLPDGSIDVVTAFEVFEHLTDPGEAGGLIRRVLRPAGAILLSTELYEPGVHGADWHYLSYDAGQHILFWTRKAVRVFAARYGFRSVGYFPGGPFRCAVLTRLPAAELTALLDRAADRFGAEEFTAEVTGRWQVSPVRPPAARPPADVDPAGGEG